MERLKGRKKYWIVAILLLAASFFGNIYWNNTITVHTYIHTNGNLPAVFSGFRIVQLTDIHSVRTEKQGQLIYEKTAGQNPDIICITGDLVDSKYYADHGVQGEALTISLVQRLVELAPVYYVYGNHEMILLDDPQRNAFKVALEEAGVNIINNEVISVTTKSEEGKLYIVGIQDPSTLYKDLRFNKFTTNGERMEAMLDLVMEGIPEEDFVLMLSHRPEYLELYDQYEIDVCLSGHAHGGQFRIPFVGGVYAPGQGFLPKYTVGVYETDDLALYVGYSDPAIEDDLAATTQAVGFYYDTPGCKKETLFVRFP